MATLVDPIGENLPTKVISGTDHVLSTKLIFNNKPASSIAEQFQEKPDSPAPVKRMITVFKF
jgi:hypothetical protein